MNENLWCICVMVFIILFAGEPNLMSALIHYLMK
jgi:hypothetical protein